MFAQDWTFDLFMADVATVRAGGSCEDKYRDYFVKIFVDRAQKFLDDWKSCYGSVYAPSAGYVGDAYKAELADSCFSDFYKDAYGQRPHLPYWYYVQAVGLPMQEDIGRRFCASPVEDAVEAAQAARASF